jgi:L-seryl-tRNA(Ser) seleniumtransferase
MARAVRVDKLQVAALEAVLAMHAAGRHAEIPVPAMLREPLDAVGRRAHDLSRTIGGELEGARVRRCEAVVGGGSMPGTTLPSWGVEIRVPDASAFAARLRTGRPPVFCRLEADRIVLDVRTVFADQLPHLARAVMYALEGDDFDEDT